MANLLMFMIRYVKILHYFFPQIIRAFDSFAKPTPKPTQKRGLHPSRLPSIAKNKKKNVALATDVGDKRESNPRPLADLLTRTSRVGECVGLTLLGVDLYERLCCE